MSFYTRRTIRPEDLEVTINSLMAEGYNVGVEEDLSGEKELFVESYATLAELKRAVKRISKMGYVELCYSRDEEDAVTGVRGYLLEAWKAERKFTVVGWRRPGEVT